MEVQSWQETQRRQAEEAMRQSEALYHSLVEMLPLQVWCKDLESRFTFANRGFCEATGRSLSDLIGKTDFDLFPIELAEKYRQDDQRVLASGQTFEDLEEHLTAKGEKLHVHVVETAHLRRARSDHRDPGHLLGRHRSEAAANRPRPGHGRAGRDEGRRCSSSAAPWPTGGASASESPPDSTVERSV